MTQLIYSDLSKEILDAAYYVHTTLGPGLLESTYEACLEYQLLKNGIRVERQKSLSIIFDDCLVVDNAYRLDLLVDNKIIIELKATESLADVHFKQLLTYLKLSKMRIGFLMNFNTVHLKDGIYRKIM